MRYGWVDCAVTLDGGMYVDREATASIRVVSEDDLRVETITIDGCIYHASIIKRQIGRERMYALVKYIYQWWDDEGREKWLDDSEADWADARYHRERDYA